MTRLFMGWKSGVGSVLKVMANDTDDPLTTPNTDYAKFRFNSETGKIGYIYDTFFRSYYNQSTYPAGGSVAGAGNKYVIEGGGFPAGKELLWARPNDYVAAFNLSKFSIEFVPIFECKVKLANGRFTKSLDSYKEVSGSASGNYYWYGWMTFTHTLGGSIKIRRDFTNGYLTQIMDRTRMYGTPTLELSSDYIHYFATNTSSQYWGADSDRFGAVNVSYASGQSSNLFVIWDLPAGNVPLQQPATPVSGQKMIAMAPSLVKVAMPGYDVDSATRQQLIIDSNRVPAKIIKCGEVALAGNGSATVATDPAFPLTGNVYVDYIMWESGYPLYVPSYRPHAISNWSNSEIVVEYAVSTNSVTFYNMRSAAVTMRYMIIGDDDAAPSTGGGKVMETGNGFQRLLRPGANSTSPAWSDILLDTRLPYLPILAEGYETVSGFSTNTTNTAFLGNKVKTVNFANGGLKPLPKVSVEFDDGSFYPPYVMLSLSNQGSPRTPHLLRQSAFCELTDTSITFRCNPDGLTNLKFNSSGGGKWTAVTGDGVLPWGAKPIGFRYYILGLPI